LQFSFLFFFCSLAEEKKAEGNAHYKVKDYRKALACYTRAIELCPDSVAYYGNRAACRMMMGLYQDALEDARESTRLDSGFAKGYVRIAKCCLALGDTAAALNAVNKAEELDPNSDLSNEKRSLQALQQFAEEIIKSNAKGDYRKVFPRICSVTFFYSCCLLKLCLHLR
jgi:DnaJ family protein C protein 7